MKGFGLGMFTLILYAEINIVGCILLSILLSNQKKSVGMTLQQKAFNILLYSIMAILVFDTGMWLIDGKIFAFSRELNFAVSTLYYIMNSLIPFLWLVYSDIVMNNSMKIRKKDIFYSLPLVFGLVMICLNFSNGYLFYIDASNNYSRGPMFFINIAISYTYLIISAAKALYNAIKTDIRSEKRQYYMMALFIIPPSVAGIIQSCYYKLSLIWISAVISCLIIFVNVQNRQIATDVLTGLNNRFEFDKYLYYNISETSKDHLLALIMIDIDRFKNINDTLGHLNGDKALICASDILKKSCRNSNVFVSRYGGDEFTIIYTAKKQDDIEQLIEHINENIKLFNEKKHEPFLLSFSIGYAVWEHEKMDKIEDLISLADQNMYNQKNSKNNL